MECWSSLQALWPKWDGQKKTLIKPLPEEWKVAEQKGNKSLPRLDIAGEGF
jgi:hypothetical protein